MQQAIFITERQDSVSWIKGQCTKATADHIVPGLPIENSAATTFDATDLHSDQWQHRLHKVIKGRSLQTKSYKA